DARCRDQPGICTARRYPRRLDDRARLGNVGRGRVGRRNADRPGGVSRTQHDAWRPALWLCRRSPRWVVQPRWRGGRRFRSRGHRKPGGDLHPLCRTRAEADDRTRADRRRADGQAERRVRPHGGEPGMTSPPRETVALAGASPRVLVIAKPTTRHLLIAATIAVALVVPFVLKSFFVFQLTLVMVYGL